MNGDLTPEPPVAEAAPPESTAAAAASASPPSDQPQAPAFDMDAAIRGMAGPRGLTSNPNAVVPTAELDSDATGESAPDSGDVSPDAAPASGNGTGRRSKQAQEAEKRIADLQAENARLQTTLTAIQPVVPDASEEARARALADEQRFRTLVGKPDDDTDWDGADWAWLQEQKRKRAVVPELQQHYETVLEADRAELIGTVEAKQAAFWTDVRSQISAKASLPHVDVEILKSAPTWDRMAEHLHAAGAAWKEAEFAPQIAARDAEIARLSEEVKDLRTFGPKGLASAPAPFAGGASGGIATPFDMDTLIRRSVGMG